MHKYIKNKGFEAKKVYEIHGSIHHLQCTSCQTIFPADNYEVNYDPSTFEAKEPLPTCTSCKKIVRPNILMFGDYEFDETRCQKQSANYHDFTNKLKKDDVIAILEFGAGHAVPTIRHLGEQLLQYNKCDTYLVRVNLRDYDEPYYKKKLDHFLAFPSTALNFMEELMKCLKQ